MKVLYEESSLGVKVHALTPETYAKFNFDADEVKAMEDGGEVLWQRGVDFYIQEEDES